MEREYIARHIRRRDSGPKAPHSLDAARKVLGRHLQDGVLEELEDAFRSTRKPVVLGYEELRGLSDPGQRDCV